MRVMTWNVGYFAIAKNKNLREVDIMPVSALIGDSGADVVVLQELGTTEQAKEIALALGEPWADYSVKTGHGEQTLSVLSRYHNQEFEVMECGGRNVISASFIHPTDVAINIVGVHSPHPVRGLNNTKTNIQCALALSDTKQESVRIITGDMNYDIDPEKNASDFYRDILKTYGDGTQHLGETYYAHTRIDHMFHYPKNLTINTAASGLVDLPLRFTKVPGFRDHRPIIVTYDLLD